MVAMKTAMEVNLPSYASTEILKMIKKIVSGFEKSCFILLMWIMIEKPPHIDNVSLQLACKRI